MKRSVRWITIILVLFFILSIIALAIITTVVR